MKKFYAFFIALFYFAVSEAQIVTIGTGTVTNTGTSYPAPYGNWYWGAKHQFLIRASELTSACALSGNITSLAFNVATAQGTPLTDFTIRMKATSATVVTSTFDNTGFTTVYGPQVYTETAGWNTHTFSTPFNWDGTSNILIEVCFNNSSYTNNAQTYYSIAAFTSSVWYRADAAGVCATATGTTTSDRPNMRLAMVTTVNPVMKPSPNNINFGTVFVGYPEKDSVYIRNIGCSNLNITSITKQTANYSFTPSSGTVTPGDSLKVVVTFAPPSTGTFLDTLKVFSNAGDSLIALSGMGALPPVISVAPTSLSTTLACTDSSTSTLTINNTGGSNLTYNISILNPTMSNLLPIAASCTPTVGAKNNCCNMGIYNVTFNSINNTTLATDGRYNDYAPTQSTILIPGQTYTLSVQTGPDYNEYVEAWIDYNNNGTFEAGELVMNVLNTLPNQTHTVSVTIPASAAKNKSVRMRISSDYSGSPIPTSCSNAVYGQTEDYTIKLLGWVALSSNSGTVTPSSSNTVAVTFNSSGLSVGTYTANISISSNDPLNNPLVVPTTLTVAGTPNLNVSIYDPTPPCVDFDSIMAYTTSKDSILLFNAGCDTLRIDSLKISPSIFTIISSQTKIAPYASGKIIMRFSPVAAGTFAGTLNIYTNELDTAVCLQGKAFPQPIITVNPTSLSDTLACVDSSTTILTINNAGGSNLTYNISILNPTMSSSLPIAATCTPTVGAKNNCCNMGIYNVTLNSINYTSLATDGRYNDYTSSQNTILVPGQTYTLSVQTGPDYNEYVEAWIDYNNNGTFEAGELVMNVLNTLPNQTHTVSVTIPASAAKNKSVRMRISSDYSGSPIPTSCSNAVYGQTEDYTIKLLGWVALSSNSGTVTPSSSNTVAVTFNSSGLSVGTYTANISISNNDPLNNPLVVPTTLKVVGAGKIALSKTCMYLDSIMTYTTHKDSLYIKNTGCDTLKVTNITKNTAIFSINATSFNILTGDSAKLIVTFAPIAAGTFYDTLTILNTDVTKKVCLSGKAFTRPIISTVPTFINDTLACCDSITIPLAISNSGGSNLNWSLNKNNNHTLNFNGTSSYVQMNNSSAFDVNQLTIEAWVYSANYNQNGFIFEKGPVNSQYSLFFEGGNLCFRTYPQSGGCGVSYYLNSSSIGITNGAWHHIAATFDGSNKKVYVDGVLRGTQAFACPLVTGQLGEIIGAYGGTGGHSYFYNGDITEVRIWNYARTQAQIAANLYDQINPSQSGLVAYYPLSEGSGSTLYDKTLNSNNGTSTNTSWLNISNPISFPQGFSATPVTGTTVAGDADTVFVKLKSCGLTVGTYTTNIVIASNDPLNMSDSIPVTLNVVGAPQANFFLLDSIGSCLDLDSIMEFTTSVDTIGISNTGCDTLWIDSLKFSPSIFSSVYSTPYILPGDSGIVVVQFAPVAAGTYTGTATIYTNDVDPVICLYGEAFPRPIICYFPDTFNVTLGCCDSTILPLGICNSGGSNLIFQVEGAGSSKINVAILAGESTLSYKTDVQAKLMATGKFNLVDIISVNTVTPTLAQLQTYDAVFVFSNGAGYANSTLLGDNLADYVDAGGGVVTATFANASIPFAGRFNTNNYWCINPSGQVNSSVSLGTVFVPNHPVLDGVTSVSGTNVYHQSSFAVNASATRVADWSDGRALVATRIINGSYRVDLGMFPPSNDVIGGGWLPSTNGALLMANALHYSVNGGGVDWMTLSPTSDTVLAGDTNIVNVGFNSCGLTVGTYTASIIINSNDPLSPSDTIPVTLNVAGTSNIVLSKNCMYLDSIMEYTTHKDSMYIKNTGCDTLKVTNITKNTTVFSVNSTAFNILPGDSAKLVVTFAPISVGTFYDTLTILNNDTTKKVCLSGKAFPRPIQCHNPNSFNVHFTICQDSIIDTLNVCNTGAGNLNYNLWTPGGRCATLDGSGDYINRNATTLPTGSVMTVEAWIYPKSYPDPTYTGVVSFGGRFCNGNAMVLSIQSNGRPSMATWCWDFVPGSGPTATLNQWNHIACVLNGTSVTLYMNGTPISGTLAGVPSVDPNNLSIGSTDYPGRYFNGKIDEVRIFNKALTQAEILAGMHNTLIGNENGLMGYWNFDNGTANDLTANGNNGTLNGNAAITTANAAFMPLSAYTGTVVPSGNNAVPVKFKKAGLPFGTTNFPIYLNSNDPLNALDTINVSMLIDSIPPAAPVANDTNVCFGNPNPPLIATGNAGDTIKWYSDAALTMLVYTGNSFVSTQTAVATYTYYVTATDSVSGCASQADTAHLFINAAPSEPVAGNASSCFAKPVPSLSSTGTIIQWWSNPAATNLLFTGNPYNTGMTVAGTYTYYVTDSTGACPKSSADTAMLTIYVLPNKPLAKDTAVCFGGPIPPLTATVTGTDSIRWYNTSMIFQASGDTFNHGQSAAGTYTYYVTSVDTVTGCESVRDTAILIINITAQPTANNVSSCFGSPAPPLVATPNNNIKWYDNLMAFIIANDSLNTGQVAVGTYTYYVTQTQNGCESNPKMVTLTINPIPATPTAPDKSSCFGSPTPALTATGTNIKWYSNATLTTQVGTGSPFNTLQTAVGTYTYYVTQTAAGCPSLSDTVYLTIYALPIIPVAADTFVCFGNPVPDLVATGVTGNDTVKWYNSPTLTPVLFTGNPYATGQTAVGTYTYYVTQTDTATGCRSLSDTVTLSINSSPVEPTANDVTVCFGQAVPSLTSTGTIVQWYTSSSPTTPVFTGNPYNTGMTAVGSYTYYVTDSTGACPESAADTAVLTINPVPAAPVCVPQIDSICFGQPNPSFSAAGTNIEWWGDPTTTTTLLFSGSPFTPTVTATGTYTAYITQTVLGCKSPSDTGIFIINPLPVVALGADVTQCGGTVTLNAGNPGANYLWSTSATTQSIIVSVSGTYSVLVTNAGGCTMTDTISITINPIPSAVVSVPQYDSICFGDPNPTFNAAGTNVEWWSNPTLTTLVFSGTAFTPTVTAAGSYTYYVTQSSLGCKSPSDTVVFVINFTPALAVNDTSTSFGTPPVVLSASGTNVQWYDVSMNPVGSGNSYNTGQTAVGTYTYIVTQTMNNCESANDTIVLTIYPGAPLAANDTVCFGQPVPDLTATGTNIQWYDTSGTLVGTGSPFATGQTAAGTYTYYVTQTINFVESPSDTVFLVINALPSAPASADQNACFGGTIPDLTAAGTNIQWYDMTPALVFSGSPFATGQTAVGTYTYNVTQTSSATGCESDSTTVTLTINPAPVAPVASNDTTICYGDPTPDLTAAGTNIQWYDTSGTVVGTGSPFASGVTAPGTYTFIATQTNTVTTCESAGDTVLLTINSTTPPVAPDVAVCFGTPVPPLTATGTNIEWYDNLGNPVFSGSPFNTGQTAVGTYTYFVTQTNTVTACSSPQDTVYLTISSQPTLAPTVSDTDACFASAIPDLVATSGTIINWYNDPGLTNLVYSGNPYATGLTAVGSYTFFATDSTPGCPEGPSSTVVLTINSLPATLAVNDTAICFGSATPDLIAVGNNITWFDTSMAIVSTNDTFATGQTAAGSYTYYVTQTNTVTTCASLPDTVMLTINALPSAPVALDTAVCSAAAIPNLTATGTNVQWYDTSWTLVTTGNSFATGQTAAGTYTYYATDLDAATGCESAADTSVLTIMLSPAIPTANNAAVCAGNPVPPLTSTGTNVNWYSNAALTTLVNTGNTFNTGQTAVGVYTYWVTDSLTGCVSSGADSVTLTISNPPATPTATNNTVCYGNPATLTSTGTNPQWYSDPTLINNIGSGSPFNPGVTAVGTYTYYVVDYAPGCGNSISDTAVLTINPAPLVTANTYSTTIVQGDSTTLTAYNAVTYTWSPATGLNTTTGATVIATPSVTTTYTVTGTNSFGCSSSVSILVVVNPLGVTSYSEPVQDVNIYPNPAVSSFTLEFNTTLETPIDIYMINMLGDKVRVIESDATQGQGLMKHTYKVDTQTLTEGVYHIEIVTDKGTVNRRVVLFR